MTVRDTSLFHSWHRADFRRLNPEVRKVIYAQILRFSWRALRQIGLLTTEGEKLEKKSSHLLRRHDSSRAGCPSDPCHAPSEWSYSAHIYVFRQDLCS